MGSDPEGSGLMYLNKIDGNANPAVVIVDDDGDVRQLLRLILSKQGWKVIEAADGQEGLNLIRKCRPELALVDILMPGHPNGLELLGEIRKEKIKGLRIVMVSAVEEFDNVLAAARLQCDAYVLKPFGQDHLTETIRRVMDGD